MKPGHSLRAQSTRLLLAGLIGSVAATVGLLLALVIAPLAQREANDLSALMVLTAQTWVELPPRTRAAYEAELSRSHALRIRADMARAGVDEWHPPFYYLLEAALARRLGHSGHLVHEPGAQPGDAGWYWAQIPTGGRTLGVGISATRVGAQPVVALALALALAAVLAVAVAWRLARRITQPLQALAEATAVVGDGRLPPPLPEQGPAELASLSRSFNRMAHQVRELLTARTVLLAGISHDLRTPLTRMKLAVELLRVRPGDAALLSRLDDDIAQADQLITQVLQMARGLEAEAPAAVDLCALLDELARTHGTDVLTPVRALPCDAPTPLWLPPLALRRVLDNFLQNARRYAGGAPIELQALRVPQADGNIHWRIEVRDRGPGIAADQRASVFEPFVRLEPSRSRATGGSGLGLAIVRQLAQAQGWQVALTPREGGGLVASVDLGPVAEAPSSAVAEN